MTTTTAAAPSVRDVYYHAQEDASFSGWAVLLVLIALLGAGFGALLLTRVTMGVGLICGACLLGIWARIVQSSVQHRALIRAIRAADPER